MRTKLITIFLASIMSMSVILDESTHSCLLSLNALAWNFFLCTGFGMILLPSPDRRFVPGNDEAAFGFWDPAQVIHSIHLIPAFAWGHVDKYLPQRSPAVIACGINFEPDSDWQLYYYIAM